MIEITPLERAVMEWLLSDAAEPTCTLRKQYDAASITKRDLTGAGFFIYFSVPDYVDRLGKDVSAKFGDVIAKIKGLSLGAGFVLHINHGAIDFLEGYSYEEPWPKDTSDFVLSRDKGLTENKEVTLETIRKNLLSR
jgi:hypothetical protein